jgi:hypothetical protein
LFAALRCIELGIKPIVFERGKNVKDRRRDLAAINKEHIVNTESNLMKANIRQGRTLFLLKFY